MPDNDNLLLKVDGISKRYGGVQALDKVKFELRPGEVHALVGENGAGKSTLIKAVCGVIPRDEGKIMLNGKEVNFRNPIEAQAEGIAVIHQELTALPHLNVIENMFMGRMESRFGMLNWGYLEKETLKALEIVNLDVDPYATMRDLPISQRQLIEIASAVSSDAKLVFMDEPNSSLSETDSERLFDVINTLTARGIGIIYVSHKIEEVLRISDRITVFRDGAYVDTVNVEDASVDSVISMMVGRELVRTKSVAGNMGDTILEVNGLTGKNFSNVSFSLQEGEILGFSGLVGAGRSEVLRAIFGADPYTEGTIKLHGQPVHFSNPSQAIKHGLAMVPEDRKVLSLFMAMKIAHNVSMAQLPFLGNFINETKERSLAQEFVQKLDIRLDSIENPVRSLSGGNQQKTVLARWLATEPKLLILDEPTHGVDVGAKAEIYDLIRNLADEGLAIILISSELPEIMSLSHRIAVMHEGRITGIIPNDDSATEEILMAYSTGMNDEFSGIPDEEKILSS